MDQITPFQIGNNPGWYGSHYTDEQIHELMKAAGNTSTRYFIDFSQWENYGMDTFTQRIQNVYRMGMTRNVYALSAQFHTSYKNQDTEIFKDPEGREMRTMRPAGLYEPIYKEGIINPANRFAVYVAEAIMKHGRYFDYFEIWNEPDITYNTGPADDPNMMHSADSWWHRQPQPWELWNWVASVKDYVRLCEVGYTVIKKLRPAAKVCTGGLGFASFSWWFHKYGGGKFYDVFSFHAYPMYYARDWSNESGGFVYNRHSDHILKRLLERVQQFKNVMFEFGMDKKPLICTEINVPRQSSNREVFASELGQINFTLKLFGKLLQADVSRTWLFIAGESAMAPQGFEFMGLYNDLTKATPGKEVLTGQGLATRFLNGWLGGATYNHKFTTELHLPPMLDGVAFKTKAGLFAALVWLKTSKDDFELGEWAYRFTRPGNYTMIEFPSGKEIDFSDSREIAVKPTSVLIIQNAIY